MNRVNGPGEQANEKRKTKSEKGKTESADGKKDTNKPTEPPKA